MSREVPEQKADFATSAKLKVTLLGSEWTSSAGGLSTLNRELAIHLSQHPEVEVSFLVPQGACTNEDKREAQRYGITVFDADKCPAYDPLDWLSFPPQGLTMDVVFGHDVKLGRQGQIIRDQLPTRFPNCKWVQVVHTAPEDLSKYKSYASPISKGEKKHKDEVDLCKLADLVVPIGPRLEKAYSSYLRRHKKGQDVFAVTPGLFRREFADLEQAPNENGDFQVLLCGRGDNEDFELKGYNIAVQAFSDLSLKRKPYHLIFVGAPDGKQDEVRKNFLQCGIAEEQLTVRKFVQSREGMKDLLCEVDLAIMPSKSEGFGLVALEALSAGLPILVGSKSGFASALKNIPYGESWIVNSDDPTKWAEAIEDIRVKHRMRLKEVKTLRASYDQEYSWKAQCDALVKKLLTMVHEPSSRQNTIQDVVGQHPVTNLPETEPHLIEQPSEEGTVTLSTRTAKKPTKRSSPESTSDHANSSKDPRVEPPVEQQSAAVTPHAVYGAPALGQQSPPGEEKGAYETLRLSEDEGALLLKLKVTTQNLDAEKQKIFSEHFKQHIDLYLKYNTVCPSSQPHEGVNGFFRQLEDIHNALVKAFKLGCLEITVQCSTLESLESLWIDYCSGHLNEVAERFLVTNELKRKLNLETVRLKTTISEESYFMCKKAIMEMSREGTSSGFLPEHTDPTGKDSRQADQFQKDGKQSMNWMIRAERAKASRSALHKASISGLSETVKMFLYSGEDVDQRDQFSLTPLHLACWYGQESVVRLLLEHGANVNAVDRFQRTALQKAERQNHRSIVELLLENNATPSFQQPSSLKTLARMAVLKVDRRSGFNLLQAAVLEADYSIVSKASALLDGFMKEMNAETTANDANTFSGKSAAEILSSLERRRPGHGDIDKLYQGMVEKVKTLNELHWCANSDDAEKVIELVLHEGIDINIPAKSHSTPLLWASQSSSSTLIQTLIDLGADINVQRTDDKAASLLLATSCNNYMATRLLLEHGADANVEKTDGCTPLLWSVHQGLSNVCYFLITSGCNINQGNKAGETPLYIAVKKNRENLVRMLLANNADVNIQDINGNTPLHEAARGGSFNISRLLIEAGCNVNLKNSKSETPLNIATMKHHEDLVKFLLENKADASIQDADGYTPMHWSVFLGFLNIFQRLAESECNINLQNSYGETLLHMAASSNRENLVKLLLENNADVNIRDLNGNTPLHESVRGGFFIISQLLIESGCNINPRNKFGQTPLHIAVKENRENLVKLLLGNNADGNIQDYCGNAPVHESTSNGNFNITYLLIESGCNINLPNNFDTTPLQIAITKNREDLVKLFVENNEDVDIVLGECFQLLKVMKSACHINLETKVDVSRIPVKENRENRVESFPQNNAEKSIQSTIRTDIVITYISKLHFNTLSVPF